VSHDADDLRAALEAHGLAPVSFSPVPTGKFNESWFVRLEDGREVVLRVAPPDDAGFLFYERNMMRQEPGLHRLIRERTSIPVAEVLVHDFSRTLIDRDFLVMERLPGTATSQTRLSASAMDRALEDTGRHLRELHDRCLAEKYGYLGEHDCMEPAGTWVEAFRVMWSKLVEDIRSCGVYDADEAGAVREALTPHLALFDREVAGSLLHMDIWAQNILVGTDGRVTGLVDWDRALWGDVETEFAVLDYCGVSEAPFWRGYGKVRDGSEAARVRGAFYYLYELQKYIVIRTLRSKRPHEALAYKAHAARLLKGLA
jgi:fructosamine-3-kinase